MWMLRRSITVKRFHHCNIISVIGTILDSERVLEFAKLGAYCQYDLFGTECSYYQLHEHFDMPSDAQRMDRIVELVKEGYEERVLMSHDIHTKHRLVFLNHQFQLSRLFANCAQFYDILFYLDGLWRTWLRPYSE